MRVGRKLARESKYVVCPRCKLKSLSIQESCPECGLVFSRMALATNRDAKKKIKRGDRDFIIMTNKLPSDVSWFKLLLLTMFMGLLGAHCFYVGRYWRGAVHLLNTLMLVCCVIFNDLLYKLDDGRVIAALATIGGIVMLFWAFDLVWVIAKKFKVPVAIDLQGDTAKEDIEKEDNK